MSDKKSGTLELSGYDPLPSWYVRTWRDSAWAPVAVSLVVWVVVAIGLLVIDALIQEYVWQDQSPQEFTDGRLWGQQFFIGILIGCLAVAVSKAAQRRFVRRRGQRHFDQWQSAAIRPDGTARQILDGMEFDTSEDWKHHTSITDPERESQE